MKKALIVYYSRSGRTRKVLQEAAELINADMEELIDNKNRSGILGLISAGKDGSRKAKTTLKPVKFNPGDYDVVIIGTPTWASNMSSAVRTYIEQNRNKFKQVAFIATQAGEGNGKIFNDLAELSGKSALATCCISGKELKGDTWQEKIKEFTEKIGSM